MHITVIGKSPSWQDAGGACSGYLVEEGGTRVLLDCGNGVFGKLRARCDYTEVDAVVISHLHADHCLDLIPFAYALTYSPRQQPWPVGGYPGTDSPARPRLVLPSGGTEAMRTLSGLWGGSQLVERAFACEEYEPDDIVEVGALRLRFGAVPHWVPTCAIEVTPVGGGRRFVYGADSAPNEEIIAFGAGADLLMLEATLPRPERDGIRGHLTAEEAGAHGRAAAPARLVVTHISDELDPDLALARASAAFGRPAELACEDAEYDI
ncbi:MAG TPA: MBL fold metallo-hydrolase [Solirubrobacteraceae bacterium]|nr:MBL fold metallo-hydrolase [Solirubrobacteraceae bacterium]